MNFTESFKNIYNYIRPVLDIGILTFLLYKVYELLLRTNAVQLLRAAIIVGLFFFGIWILDLKTLLWLARIIAPTLMVCFAILFQPEMRKIFLKLGQADWFSFGARSKHTSVDSVLIAADILSKMKRGMLVVFPRHTRLDNFMDSGTRLDAEISSNLLVTIFGHDTPLHDLACFVKDGKILAAGCLLPLSEQIDIKKTYGSRHRAALGMSEQSDAVVLVVSEESGAISLAYDSQLHYDLSMDQLTKILEKMLNITSKDKKIEDTIDEHKALS